MLSPTAVLVVLAVLVVAASHAQPARPSSRAGDSTVAAAVGRELRAIYDAARPGRGVLTPDNALRVDGAIGTDLRGFVADQRLVRVVADVWTGLGKYAVEYFYTRDTLIFVFETYAYLEDAPVATTSRNFWGLRSWERRTYFTRGGAVGYAETIGDGGPAPGLDGERLRSQARRARAVLAAAPAP